MKNFPILLTLSLALLLFNTGCIKDLLTPNQNTNAAYPNIDNALKPYFKRFEQEATVRGFSVDLSTTQLTGVISDIETARVLGQCSYNHDDPFKVTIDKPFWDKASDLGKEFVVFHELGHCYLGRGHDESVDSRGICLSIMRSGTGTCRDNYNTITRVKLLDELFTGN